MAVMRLMLVVKLYGSKPILLLVNAGLSESLEVDS